MELHSWNATQYGLGLVPTTPEKRALCAATPLKTLPEIEWHAVNRRAYFKQLKTNNNQKSTSGCVGFSAAHLASKVRHVAGQPYVKLSGPFVYGLINGGRDQGAMIYDALDALTNYGACTDASLPLDANYKNIYRSAGKPFDDEAARFKLSMGVRIESAEEAATVILKGGMIQFGVKVGNNFSNLDGDGVCGWSSGYANHSVGADGLVHTDKHGWCLDVENTWGYDWGDDGRFLFPLDWLEKVGYQECFAHIASVDDPADDFTPPEPK